MDMVERVARALNDAGLDYVTKDDARRAIKAMREPTEAMVWAGHADSGPGMRSIWSAMIDAALSEADHG